MDAYKREKRIASDIQLAIAKLSHLNELLWQINEETKKVTKTFEEAKEEFEKFKEKTHER